LSIIATLQPAARQRDAIVPAAAPDPMTIKSNVRVITFDDPHCARGLSSVRLANNCDVNQL
jgi:hypothetical protein